MSKKENEGDFKKEIGELMDSMREYEEENKEDYNLLKEVFIEKMYNNEHLGPNEFTHLCYENDEAYYKVKEFVDTCDDYYKARLGYLLYQNLTISARMYSYSTYSDGEMDLSNNELFKNDAHLFLYLFSCFSVISHNFNYNMFLIGKGEGESKITENDFEDYNSFKYGESYSLLIRCLVFVETVLDVFNKLPKNISFFYRSMSLKRIKEDKERYYGNIEEDDEQEDWLSTTERFLEGEQEE